MNEKKTWITVDGGSRYVGIGIENENELCIIDVNFIENEHYWGIFIADEDNKFVETAKLTDGYIKMDCCIFGVAVTFEIWRFAGINSRYYEICVTE